MFGPRKDLLDIISRLEHLETDGATAIIGGTLALAEGKIASLAASQDAEKESMAQLRRELLALASQVESEGPDALAQINSQLELFRATIQETRLAVADGIERVDRAERRIKATVKRARSELAAEGFESSGLEAENHELQLLDGGRSGERELPPVSEEVENVDPAPSSIPGVTADALRKVTGI